MSERREGNASATRPLVGISIVLCTHNGAARLPPTLAHLAAQRVRPDRPWEIVLVDNASSDATAATAEREWPRAAAAPLRVIHEGRLGLGHARRRGITAAAHPLIAFVDDDNWLAADWAETAARTMASHPEVGALGGTCVAVYEAPPPTWLERFTPLLAIGPRGVPPGDITDAPGLLWGAGLVLRKAAWERLERIGFTPTLVGRAGAALSTGEDTELCLALRLAGWRLWYEPGLRLQHQMPPGRLTWSYMRRLHRTNGAASVRHDAYYVALRRYAPDAFAPLRRRWWWQTLAALKGLARLPLGFLRGLGRGTDGNLAVAHADVLRARLGELARLRGEYDANVRRVLAMPWSAAGPAERRRVPGAGIRVVHVVPALFGPGGVVGGAERYALELARWMAREVAVTLVTFGEYDRRERDGDLDIRVLGNPWYVRGQRTNPWSVQLLDALHEATVVHCHQQHIVASSLAAAYCRATRRRVFVTDLGGGGWDISGYHSTDGWFDGHLHISEYSRRVFGHGEANNARVILGGVDLQRFAGDDAPRGDEVLYVGRILPHKGINYLIDALPADVPLRVIGQVVDHRFVADLHRLARGKRVTFQHDADDAALLAAYRTALCVVLPSVYRTVYGQETTIPELLGQTVLEAMACGAPVVATSVASLPEVVAPEVTGFLVPPNDAAALADKIAWLRAHPARAAEMGAAGRRRVEERFTWPAVVRRCFAAYFGGDA